MESASFFISETWLEQHFHATGTFDANNDEVPVWELASLLFVNYRIGFELCVVNKTCVAQFLFDILRNLPLCGGSQYPRSVRFFIKYSAGSDTDDTKKAYRLADVKVTLHETAERKVMETAGFFTSETWLEQTSETGVSAPNAEDQSHFGYCSFS